MFTNYFVIFIRSLSSIILELTKLSNPLQFFFKVHHMDYHLEFLQTLQPAVKLLEGGSPILTKIYALKFNIDTYRKRYLNKKWP